MTYPIVTTDSASDPVSLQECSGASAPGEETAGILLHFEDFFEDVSRS
jgi:hypothetical protein